MSLVRGIGKDPGRRAAVTGLAYFAKELGSLLLGEGIETEAEFAALRELGVELAQGYLLGRPAAATSFADTCR